MNPTQPGTTGEPTKDTTQPGYRCRVLADSVGGHGCRISTVEVRFPRIALADFRTYAMLAYSVRSSRAVPTATMIEEVEREPFFPANWRLAQKGMTPGAEMGAEISAYCRQDWENARAAAVKSAWNLSYRSAAKHHVNRLLEPFAWSWAVVTGTMFEWNHFIAQRTAADVQDELRVIACMIRDALTESEPKRLAVGDFHLPYVTRYESDHGSHLAARISAARCARVSYKPFSDGEATPEAERGRSEKLFDAGHWGPFDHPAMCCATPAYRGKLAGWMSYRTWIGR